MRAALQTQTKVREAIASAAETAARKTAEQWQLRLRQEVSQAMDSVRTARAEAEAAQKQLVSKEREFESRSRELEAAVTTAREQAQREVERLTAQNQQLLASLNEASRRPAQPSSSSLSEASIMAMLMKSAMPPPPPPQASHADAATAAVLSELRAQLGLLTAQVTSMKTRSVSTPATPMSSVDDGLEVIESVAARMAQRQARLDAMNASRGLSPAPHSYDVGASTMHDRAQPRPVFRPDAFSGAVRAVEPVSMLAGDSRGGHRDGGGSGASFSAAGRGSESFLGNVSLSESLMKERDQYNDSYTYGGGRGGGGGGKAVSFSTDVRATPSRRADTSIALSDASPGVAALKRHSSRQHDRDDDSSSWYRADYWSSRYGPGTKDS
jgi:hypothetical protein